MMNVFKDKALEEQFNQDGYVVLDLVDGEKISQQAALYKQVQPVSLQGFSSTIYNPDIDLKRKTSEDIQALLIDSVQGYFHNYRPMGSSFLCKTPGQESFMPVHQDWTIVDESKYFSITIWIPLVDVDEVNGAMRVLPGSHKFSDVLRSPTLSGAFQKLNDDIYQRMEWVKVKAGQAVVFTQALLHASPANLSESDRIVTTYGLVPEEAELSFYHNIGNGKVEKYAIQDDFFITYNDIGTVPQNAVKQETFDYSWKEWGTADLNAAIHGRKQKLNAKNMKRLFKDDAVQEFFNVNGYVRIPMLDEADVKVLYDYFFEQGLRDQSGYGFNMSMEDGDKEKVARIRAKIFEVALPKALQHLDNPRVLAGSYVVKDTNPKSVVPPHQDWTFVDNEGENYSVTCWIPLVPTKMENGYMGVIKGSHLIYDNTRPSPSPQTPSPLMNHLFSIFPYMEMYEMQPGEALIFDHRTFHGSTPNTTDMPRVAIGLGFTQGDSKICHFNLKADGKKDTLLKYEIDDAFLLKYDNSTLSKMYDKGEMIEGYEIAAEVPYTYPNPTSEELVALIKQAGNTFNIELCEHMAKLFGFNMDGSPKQEEPQPQQEEAVHEPQEALPFWKVYTPLNIVREIKFRLTGS